MHTLFTPFLVILIIIVPILGILAIRAIIRTVVGRTCHACNKDRVDITKDGIPLCPICCRAYTFLNETMPDSDEWPELTSRRLATLVLARMAFSSSIYAREKFSHVPERGRKIMHRDWMKCRHHFADLQTQKIYDGRR